MYQNDLRRNFLENHCNDQELLFSGLPRDIQSMVAQLLPTVPPKIDPLVSDVPIVNYNTSNSAIHDAVRRGELETLKELYPAYLAMDYQAQRQLNCVGVPNHWLGNGTLLHVAAFYNQPVILDWLIENGADPYAGNLTPLHVAAYQGHLACVQRLVEYGNSNLNRHDQKLINIRLNTERSENNNQTALSLATVHDHTDVVKYLCEQDADLNVQGAGQYTGQRQSLCNPLVLCIENGRLNSFRTILPFYYEKGLTQQNISGNGSLIDRLLEGNNIGFVTAFVEKCPALANYCDHKGRNHLQLLVMCREVKLSHIQRMLEVFHDHKKLAEFVTHQDSVAQMTPLHYLFAKCNDHPQFLQMARLLISAGANLDAKDKDGLSPIQYLPIARRATIRDEIAQTKNIAPPTATSPAQAASSQGWFRSAVAVAERVSNYINGIPSTNPNVRENTLSR